MKIFDNFKHLVFNGITMQNISKNPRLHKNIRILPDIQHLKEILNRFRKDGKVLLAYLYGSFAGGLPHNRSDIDIALYVNPNNKRDEIEIIDTILMASERDIGILRLDDEDESPFMVQRAIKGIPLIEPDIRTLYNVAHRALHETETIRYNRMSSR